MPRGETHSSVPPLTRATVAPVSALTYCWSKGALAHAALVQAAFGPTASVSPEMEYVVEQRLQSARTLIRPSSRSSIVNCSGFDTGTLAEPNGWKDWSFQSVLVMVSAAGADPTVGPLSEEGPRIVRLHAARQLAAKQSATDQTFIRYIFAPSKNTQDIPGFS